MPRGPRGERRPADVIGAADMVARLATGDISQTLPAKSGRTRCGDFGVRPPEAIGTRPPQDREKNHIGVVGMKNA